METAAEDSDWRQLVLRSRGHGPISFPGRTIVMPGVQCLVPLGDGGGRSGDELGHSTRISATFGRRTGFSTGPVSKIQQFYHERSTQRDMGDTISEHPAVVDQLGHTDMVNAVLGSSFLLSSPRHRAPPQLSQVQVIIGYMAYHVMNNVLSTIRSSPCLRIAKPAWLRLIQDRFIAGHNSCELR